MYSLKNIFLEIIFIVVLVIDLSFVSIKISAYNEMQRAYWYNVIFFSYSSDEDFFVSAYSGSILEASS